MSENHGIGTLLKAAQSEREALGIPEPATRPLGLDIASQGQHGRQSGGYAVAAALYVLAASIFLSAFLAVAALLVVDAIDRNTEARLADSTSVDAGQ